MSVDGCNACRSEPWEAEVEQRRDRQRSHLQASTSDAPASSGAQCLHGAMIYHRRIWGYHGRRAALLVPLPSPAHACTGVASTGLSCRQRCKVLQHCWEGQSRGAALPSQGLLLCVNLHSAASPGTLNVWRCSICQKLVVAPLLCFFVERCLGNLLLLDFGGSGSLAPTSSSCSSPLPVPRIECRSVLARLSC